MKENIRLARYTQPTPVQVSYYIPLQYNGMH